MKREVIVFKNGHFVSVNISPNTKRNIIDEDFTRRVVYVSRSGVAEGETEILNIPEADVDFFYQIDDCSSARINHI